MATSAGEYRRALAERVQEHTEEISDAILDRLCALKGPATPLQHRERRTLQNVIAPLLVYGLRTIGGSEREAPQLPPEAIAHAREAAWLPITTPVLQQRYVAGYTVYAGFVRREQSASRNIDLSQLDNIQQSLDASFEQLLSAVADAHAHELWRRTQSSEFHLLERINSLLCGRSTEDPTSSYPLDATHIGIVGVGGGLASALRRVVRSRGANLLIVGAAPDQVWGWIASDTRPASFIDGLHEVLHGQEGLMAVGTAAVGLEGWRLTHRQAVSALSVAPYLKHGFARYSDVALLATALNDRLLAHSLSQKFLLPLASERDGGRSLRATLQAYLALRGNVSSVAAHLGVTRHTVANRLKAAENLLGYPLHTCASELELALRLENIAGEPQAPG